MDNNETMSMDQLTSSETIDITKPAGKRKPPLNQW